MTPLYRAHFRCTDVACGWHGFDSELGEKPDPTTWHRTRPAADFVQCCPKCYGDVTSGSWCPVCGERPMADALDSCEPCFDKNEAAQDELVRRHNETQRALDHDERVRKIKEAVREYHTYKRATPGTTQYDESRKHLRVLLGLEKAS